MVLLPPATGITPFKIPDYMLAMTSVQPITSKHTQRHEPCVSSALGFVDLELREPEGWFGPALWSKVFSKET